jgi:RNA polymerase sigma factor (sigma-70 family)
VDFDPAGANLDIGAAAESERQLLESITPVLRRVIAQRLPAHDVDDVCAHVLLQVTQRLRTDGLTAFEDIDHLAGYFATVAHHACDHHLRRRHPLRWRLRNRLRYVLEHDARLALWRSSDRGWLCSLAHAPAEPDGRLPRASEVSTGEQRPREFLVEVLTRSGGPVEFAAVVALAADAWGVPTGFLDAAPAADEHADTAPPIDQRLQDRQTASLVWQQIEQLPVRQRTALLLNLRDDALQLIVLTGVASVATIATALEMPAETLAEMWGRLPIPDNDIASMLGCTRQQVINLRLAARKRLANRLASPVNKPSRSALSGGDA